MNSFTLTFHNYLEQWLFTWMIIADYVSVFNTETTISAKFNGSSSSQLVEHIVFIEYVISNYEILIADGKGD